MSSGGNSSVVTKTLAMQAGVVGAVTSIGIWQSHFVMQAATADIYVFALLFSTAVFGVVSAFRNNFALRNEFRALDAMREVHKDAIGIERGDIDEVRATRNARTYVPALIYHVPHVLGTVHNLLIEGLRRDGALQLSAATMQVLQTDVEAKLEERQALGHYLGALMVLLGLLGTFIGLMHTLESVGGILGSMDLSGNGGSEAIAKLIESLKKPLEGMSTGFGASLFGLIGSLVIGVLGRIDLTAAKALNHDFETWLRSSVQIEGSQGNAAPRGASDKIDLDEVTASGAAKAFRMMVRTSSRLAAQVDSLARANAQLLEREQTHVAEAALMRTALEKSAQAQLMVAKSLSTIGSTMAEMPARLENAAERVDQRLDIELRESRAAAQRLMQGLTALERNLVETGIATATDLAPPAAEGPAADADLNALLGRINDVIATRRNAADMRRNAVLAQQQSLRDSYAGNAPQHANGSPTVTARTGKGV